LLVRRAELDRWIEGHRVQPHVEPADEPSAAIIALGGRRR
jgi:hypothetical protein